MGRPATVAHYLVEKEIGRGAMGVVYLARDARLDRMVAIKALPTELEENPGRRARFEREARTLAAINHPNIGAIYGIEASEGANYLVLELAEGQTLAERLDAAAHAGQTLPLETTLDICAQIAAGIEAAHQRGIVHRDLKPDNVKIRPDGVVKVLDFGIAMSGRNEPAPADPNQATVVNSPVVTSPVAATISGAIIGTPGYMSPEQARGKTVGCATDLWALGCILFECLTGKMAFAGETLADVVAVTLLAEADWSALPARTPSRVLTLLSGCLEKDQRMRLGDAATARLELDRALAELKNPSLGERLSVTSVGEDTDAWDDLPGNLPGGDGAIGRDAETAELVRTLEKSRLVTIVGAPGCGKTALARAAGSTARDKYSGGAWLAELVPAIDSMIPAHLLAISLGVRSSADQATRQALANRIAARPVLIILDACQHSPAESARLAADLLGACPNLRIIATARDPLGVGREKVFPLAGLNGAAGGPAGAGAAQLLLERAAAAGAPAFPDTPDTRRIVESVCKLLQGIPLALELVAPIAAQGLADLPARIGERLALKGVAHLDRQPAAQVVNLMIDWVYDQLPHVERGLLRRLSLFAGGCTSRSAAAVSGARDSFPDPAADTPTGQPVTQLEAHIAEMIGRLAARGLATIERNGESAPDRFHLPEAVAQYARSRLFEATGAGTIAQTHARYWRAVAENAVPRLAGPMGPQWGAAMEAEYANLQCAAELTGTSDRETTARLAELIGSFREWRGLAGQ